MSIRSAAGVAFDLAAPVLIVGAGACGLIAALAARDAGAEVLVLERDASPSGSTALSSGMIPAAGTRAQAERGIRDDAACFAADIQRKAKGENDPGFVSAVTSASGPVVDWLMERHGVGLTLVEGFLYPGHSRPRMHAPPSRSGSDLVAALLRAVQRSEVDIVASARVVGLFAEEDGRIAGAEVLRPDGGHERVGCRALILACSGFGGDRDLLLRYIPDMVHAHFQGHVGNRGDALRWGQALGAATRHLDAYQGHGSVATPHNILVTWAVMMAGGVQVNAAGRRFSNEHAGYSEQAVHVLAQPGGVAWNIYDARIHRLAQEFEDYRAAEAAGAIRHADDAASLAVACAVPAGSNLTQTLAETSACASGHTADPFGRDFTGSPPLAPPYFAVKVTGPLFHTQGGLVVDGDGRVLRPNGLPLPNLFAGGGAACGVSGSGSGGYLSGNGLLTAAVLGAKAGASAARIAGG